jgi:hypothetical protein
MERIYDLHFSVVLCECFGELQTKPELTHKLIDGPKLTGFHFLDHHKIILKKEVIINEVDRTILYASDHYSLAHKQYFV